MPVQPVTTTQAQRMTNEPIIEYRDEERQLDAVMTYEELAYELAALMDDMADAKIADRRVLAFEILYDLSGLADLLPAGSTPE
jgi:hypothetical protein